MNSARERILRRLKITQRSLSDANPNSHTDPLSGSTAHQGEHQADARTAGPSGQGLTQLLENLSQNRIEVVRGGQDQAEQLVSRLASQGLTRWLLGSSALADSFESLIAGVPGTETTRFIENFEVLKNHIFDKIDVGLSSAHAAIADTGTLLLRPDATEPRTLSLIPPVHVIVLNPHHIFGNLESCLASIPDTALRQNSNTLFISSPSKTADIQQKLAYGAHGPKRVIVFLDES